MAYPPSLPKKTPCSVNCEHWAMSVSATGCSNATSFNANSRKHPPNSDLTPGNRRATNGACTQAAGLQHKAETAVGAAQLCPNCSDFALQACRPHKAQLRPPRVRFLLTFWAFPAFGTTNLSAGRAVPCAWSTECSATDSINGIHL
uniref:Uncharacterized protein n=1 Tax=Globodera rostochiensis TaxID=31243 RepID=A0A914HMH6_GLORO